MDEKDTRGALCAYACALLLEAHAHTKKFYTVLWLFFGTLSGVVKSFNFQATIKLEDVLLFEREKMDFFDV